MGTLLAKGAAVIATLDPALGDIKDASLFCRDGLIEQVGPESALPKTADEVLHLRDHVVIPGLVNTHHHIFQNLTRAVPAGQDATLFNWLKALMPIWANMGPEHIYVSALLGLAEMALTGCTTSSDHLYMFPNGARLDDEIQAAREVGIRFHAARGALSIGESKGGLPPDNIVEDEAFILQDTRRVLEQYHDAGRFSMLRVVVAPCSPFTVSQGLMKDSAALARAYKVSMHTHTAENDEDIAYAQARFGMRPGDYSEAVGWTGPDVWHAHCVKLDAHEIGLFGRTGTGVAHCPSSNMRLASGIAPVRRMLDAGVPVGLGVDGSASNDSGHLLNEARHAMLVQRLIEGPAGLKAREALHIATAGGARVLGRDDIGVLRPGMAADFAAFRLDTIDMSGGAQWDPVASLLFCGPQKASATVINGRCIVRDGQITTIDLPKVIERHGRLARALANGEAA
ncbi:MAG: 8-oxoguanine deaminase [Hyphomicrobiales bacterium]|nr:MAG: 8-oxoguanine deaminase [Hyphomicrobiales bacterium]